MSSHSNRPANQPRQRRKRTPDEQTVYWREAEAAADERPKAAARACDHPGCAEPGAYRAPKSRQALNDFHWFCLPHVQEYNKQWNYYQGLSIDEMEDVRRQDIVGWRPTWPLGKLGGQSAFGEGAGAPVTPEALRAHIFSQFQSKRARVNVGGGQAAGAAGGHKGGLKGISPEEANALSRLGLTLKASWYEIKRRYRELALANHPDLNPSAAAADNIKAINRAYTVLKRRQQNTQAE